MKISLLIMLVGLGIGTLNLHQPTEVPPKTNVSWPVKFEDEELTALSLSERDAAFADSFPGAMAVFETSDGRQIIFRQVNRATRLLHESATCLQAAGHVIGDRKTEDGWITYQAHKNGLTLHVREQIQSKHATWTDVSAWFWHALFHPNDGPWLAVTVLEG